MPGFKTSTIAPFQESAGRISGKMRFNTYVEIDIYVNNVPKLRVKNLLTSPDFRTEDLMKSVLKKLILAN